MYNFILAPCDTDSISFCKPDMTSFSEEEQQTLLDEINSQMPELIRYAHDGYFDVIVAVKAKNYILYDGKKIKIKGSSLVASMKELALKEFINRVIDCFVFDKQDQILSIYHEYVREIYNVKDISRWTSKKTITESVLNPERTNEQKVFDAIQGTEFQEGDKIRVYFDLNEALKLEANWCNDHDPENLVEKLYKTLEIFDTILDMSIFPKYHLKNHNVKCQLAEVLGLPHPEKVKRVNKKKGVVNEVFQAENST